MIRLMLIAGSVALAQPSWSSIAGAGYQHFLYGGGKAVEQDRFEWKLPQPAAYRFLAPPAPRRSVCAIEDRPGVYWYTPEGKKLNGTFAVPNPTEFTVSPLQSAIRGFAVTMAFTGAAARGGAVGVAYFADRPCSDGTVEYGFSRDLSADATLVYWATFANCANDAGSLCRKTDDPSLGEGFSNVQQENSGTKVDHGFRIYGLDAKARYTYRMFVEGRGFRVEVWSGDKLARCSDRPGVAMGACTFLKIVQPWFPIDQVTRGHISVGTQTVGNPGVAPGARLEVFDTLVAR